MIVNPRRGINLQYEGFVSVDTPDHAKRGTHVARLSCAIPVQVRLIGRSLASRLILFYQQE